MKTGCAPKHKRPKHNRYGSQEGSASDARRTGADAGVGDAYGYYRLFSRVRPVLRHSCITHMHCASTRTMFFFPVLFRSLGLLKLNMNQFVELTADAHELFLYSGSDLNVCVFESNNVCRQFGLIAVDEKN